MQFSVIVPVLEEVQYLPRFLEHLKRLNSYAYELIVVDGGSHDESLALSKRFADHVLTAPRGRANQMNAGAQIAKGDMLVFLHADTFLPPTALLSIEQTIAKENTLWGGFDVSLSGDHLLYRIIERMINLRSRTSGIITGDQVMFVRRETFQAVGGFPQIPLMEDIEISKRLKRQGQPTHIQLRVVTSSRMWEDNGILRTITKMWALRLAYFIGVNPHTLVKYYYGNQV